MIKRRDDACHKCGEPIVFEHGMYFLDYMEIVDGVPINRYICTACKENGERVEEEQV